MGERKGNGESLKNGLIREQRTGMIGSSSHGTPSRRACVVKPPRRQGDGVICLSLDKSIVQNGSSTSGHKSVGVCAMVVL